MDQGCLDAFSNTNERTRAEYVVGGRHSSRANSNPNGTSATLPDFSGSDDLSGLTNHQNHQQQQGQYYEASRHSSKPPSQYQRSPANTSLTPLSASTSNTYFNYPSAVDTMSLSYETRTFPSYPSMMHEHPQEQDDNDVQHHRYPSPPPPLSENPYHPQNIDPTAGINMEMPELPQKDESDAPSPGRSRPIPKPDREVTKGEDGRFICTWTGCTEEVKSFNRKCEWSKVSGCAFPKYFRTYN
jgi:hypothetical protein